MAKLTILITEKIPLSLRGELSKWMLELKSGIFVGTLSALVREKLWNKVCDKVKEGGAFLIHPMNNEQRFEIETHGTTRRTIVDYDGITLVKIPLSPRKTIPPSQKIKEKHSTPSKPHTPLTPTPVTTTEFRSISPEFSHPNQKSFPDNFIWRLLTITMQNNQIQFNYQGMSSFPEIPYTAIWHNVSRNDLETICTTIFKVIQDSNLPHAPSFSHKRILSLDIETTDYLPKAYEGFVNILGLALLDFTNSPTVPFSFTIHQLFNMTRKKEKAPHLLRLLSNEIQNADLCILFNKNFDLTILNTIIHHNHLALTFPASLLDLNTKFRKLADLEHALNNEIGFHRQQTHKSKFSEYYKSFKGIGTKGKNKKLEPLGSYNLLDVLTPLLYYLLHPDLPSTTT
ncbi:MAG: type I-E CRISPR-associated endoribonuclease Cas2e [Candidatus Helarchaeota archaeon]